VSFGATSEAKENYFAGATRNSTGLNLISIASPSAFAGTNQKCLGSFTLFHSGVERFIEFFGPGKNWRGFGNFVPEFLIDAWAGMAKLPVRF
jgi:hypothetical protein